MEDAFAKVEVEPSFPLARQVSEALSGANFPLRRDQLIWVARENEASPVMLSLLHRLPDREFASLDEVQERLLA